MFNRLRKKWDVSAKQFWVIFTAFGFTGLTTAYITKVITVWLGMNETTWWVWRWSVKLAMLLIGYQILLLFYGALFGQWAFFWKYEKKLLQKMGLIKKLKVENRKVKIEEDAEGNPETPLLPIAIGNAQGTSATHQTVGDTEDKLETRHPKLPSPDSYQGSLREPETRNQKQETRIAIFASGAGTNAEKIIEHFAHHASIKVGLIVCNKPGAGVLTIAAKNNIPTLIIEKEKFFRGDGYVPELKQHEINFIVLAGFLWKIPQSLIDNFRNHIINIHPALLPKFGGKGMYGNFVHAAVIEAGETESGITIHYVDEHYDNGDIIFQAKCEVSPTDTSATLAKKIHGLEHKYFPEVIEKVVLKRVE